MMESDLENGGYGGSYVVIAFRDGWGDVIGGEAEWLIWMLLSVDWTRTQATCEEALGSVEAGGLRDAG
jgi:hypothetical protein